MLAFVALGIRLVSRDLEAVARHGDVVSMVVSEQLLKQHVVNVKTPIRCLEIAKAFEALTHEEALYAHHFAEASWKGPDHE